MATENDIIKDAIIGTEKEIFASAFGKEDLTLDETGDRSLEAMGEGLEGQVEPEDEDEGDEAIAAEPPGQEPGREPKVEGETPKVEAETPPTEAKPDPLVKPGDQGRVPAGRLREEAERARAAIAERDALKAQLDAKESSEQRLRDALMAEFDRKLAKELAALNSPLKPAETPETPDLFVDPVAFAEHINKGVQSRLDALTQQMRDREVNASLEAARIKHGPTYEEAFSTLKGLDYKNPDNVALVRRMEASPNPGETIVSWHKRNQALREVGTDIDSYKARIAEETRKTLMADPDFRKELLASLREDALTGDQGRVRSEVRLPKSLSQASGSNARAPNDLDMFDGSEKAIFNSAWSS